MHPTHFVQHCPVCGRPLEIRVEYLGSRLTCEHCGGRFVASDAEGETEGHPSGLELLERAEQLLAISVRPPLG